MSNDFDSIKRETTQRTIANASGTYDPMQTTSQTEQQTKIKGASSCNLHRDCQVLFDVPTGCPVCETILTAVCDRAEMRGAMTYLELEVVRLKKLETENHKLQTRIFELEDRLPEEDLEEDEPIEEPRQPEDPGAQNGVFPRAWGKEGG